MFLAGFDPSGSSDDAHHMLLYGCTEPGSEKKIWLEKQKTKFISYENYYIRFFFNIGTVVKCQI